MTTFNHYALCDPREKEVLKSIRYVGRTTRSIQERFAGHLNGAVKLSSDCYSARWIRSLIKLGLMPVVLDLGAGNDDAEGQWIAWCKARGCRLTNATEGGEGGAFTDEMKVRMSEITMEKMAPPAVRQRISAATSAGMKRFWADPENPLKWLLLEGVDLVKKPLNIAPILLLKFSGGPLLSRFL